MKRNLKRCVSFLLCAALLFCGTAYAAEIGMTLDPAKIEAGRVTVTGKTPDLESYVTLRVAKPGIQLANAGLNDYIYLNAKMPDAQGNFSFTFPVGEYKGDFLMEAVSNASDAKATGSFTFNPNGDSSIKAFSLDGRACSINGTSITLTVPSSTAVSGMIATFTLAPDASASVNGVKQQSGVTRNNFSSPVQYLVTADDGTQTLYTVTVYKEAGTGGGGGGSTGGGGGGGFTSPGKDDPVVPPEIPNTFFDVPKTFWGYEAVEEMAGRGIVKGYEDGSFRPENNITREEFVKVVVNYFDLVPQTSSINFTDVNKDEWYAYYIDIAVSNGVIKGVSANEFGVGQNISRQDMAVILDRVIALKGINLSAVNEKIEFTDGASIASYAASAVEKLQTAGVINGYEDGSFRPEANAARAEACAMLVKVK